MLLLGTPTASLPPLFTYTLSGIAQRTAQLVARYGFVQDMDRPLAPETGGHNARSLNSFGLTGILPFGLDGTVSLTGGLSDERCPTTCSDGARFMGSAAGDYRLWRGPLGGGEDGMQLTVGVNGEIGLGSPASGLTGTANVGVPLALTFGKTDATQIIPFLAPSWSFVVTGGQGAGNPSAVRAGRVLIGGGVGLFNPKSLLGASVGFQYVMVSHTEAQIGVALSIGGR